MIIFALTVNPACPLVSSLQVYWREIISSFSLICVCTYMGLWGHDLLKGTHLMTNMAKLGCDESILYIRVELRRQSYQQRTHNYEFSALHATFTINYYGGSSKHFRTSIHTVRVTVFPMCAEFHTCRMQPSHVCDCFRIWAAIVVKDFAGRGTQKDGRRGCQVQRAHV